MSCNHWNHFVQMRWHAGHWLHWARLAFSLMQQECSPCILLPSFPWTKFLVLERSLSLLVSLPVPAVTVLISSLLLLCTAEEEAEMLKRLSAFLMNRCTGRFHTRQHIPLLSWRRAERYMCSGSLLRSSHGALSRSLLCGWSRNLLSPKPSWVLFFPLFSPSPGSWPCQLSLTLQESPADW